MSGLLDCIIRTCFDGGDEGGGIRNSSPPRLRTIEGRLASVDSIGQYSSPSTLPGLNNSLVDDDNRESASGEECCSGGGLSAGGAALGAADVMEQEELEATHQRGEFRGREQPSGGLSSLFSRLGFGGVGGGYGSLVQNNDHMGSPHSPVQDSVSVSSAGRSPLRSASSFDYDKKCNAIPSIQLDEIVMPGSELQKQMSAIMAKDLESYEDVDECVICLEGFSAENPRMPTLCGCGQNKTYFHLPCLYQWIEQDRNCPSCRKKLRWQEF